MSSVTKFCYLLCVLILAACGSSSSASQAAPLRVQYSFAAQPWLANMLDCAGENVVSPELRAVDYFDISNTDFAIRIGDAEVTTLAYQIDTEEVLVIVNPQNPIKSFTSEEVLGLFSGQIANWQAINGNDAPVQVWVYASNEDIQRIFEQSPLDHAPITSLAQLAPGSNEMAQAVADDINAVGILPRHWLTGNVSAVYTVATAPVLVLTAPEPDELVIGIISCLQK
jgi:hypothetical protein